MNTPEDALVAAEPRPAARARATEKKNYAERLSRHLSTVVANGLRPYFDTILPAADGSSQESRARTGKGFKKLDVNYSTPELGLGLGVSIKTLNFVDASTSRYTKNYSRIDNELRAEATDYHVRQPYAVLIGVLFLPADSAHDGDAARADSTSSFGAAVKYFRARARRNLPTEDPELFEAFFVALYDPIDYANNPCRLFEVGEPPPRARPPRPDETYSFAETIAKIVAIYDARNQPPFEWAVD